jgi:hypothetical protein
MRCPVIKTRVLDLDGDPIKTPRYDYTQAPEYLVKGMGRLTSQDRAALRLRSINLVRPQRLRRVK